MIKARAQIGARDCVVIGLSDGNWENLRAGRPIMFDGGQLGLDGKTIVVLGGATEADMIEDLRSIGIRIPV